MDPSMPQSTALAILGNRILCVGDQTTIDSFKSSKTRIIDLQGAYVYPGFIETHMHVLYTGLAESYLKLHHCTQKTAVIEEVAKRIKIAQRGELIIGWGWDDSNWSECLHAHDLDAISPDHPVVLVRKDTHLLWVNSFVMKLAGIDKNTLSPDGGKIVKDASGHPTGIFIDKAMSLVRAHMPKNRNEKQIIKQTLETCLQMGLTTIHNAATDELDLSAFTELALANELKTRIYLMGAVRNKDDPFFIQTDYPFLKLRCLKFWMDGALGSRGAALFEPYLDDPNNSGLLLWNEEDFLKVLKRAKERNFQVATHAIGDLANHLVLDAYEKAGVKGLRFRIEHAQQLLPSDVERFGKLGVIAAMQPLHAPEDLLWLENRLGKQRVESGAFLWKSLLESGAVLTGGSDAPVVSPNPLWGIHAAITRQDPKQRLTPKEALKMYTLDAAYASFQEHELGSITHTKLADLVVLPENILECPPEALMDMKVIYTIVDGKVAFPKNDHLLKY